MKRCCQRHTQVLALPVARMISVVPTPWADKKHDLGAPYVLLRTVPVRRHRHKTAVVGGAELEGDTGAHAADSHAVRPTGIPIGTLPSGVNH